MEKQEVLDKVTALGRAIADNDIPQIIHGISELKVDTRFGRNDIVEYAKGLLIQTITDHVEKQGKISVERSDAYGSMVTDIYKIENGVLKRNCNPAEWSSLTRLYQAYRKINKI